MFGCAGLRPSDVAGRWPALRGLVEFAQDFLGLTLHPGQAEVLREWELSGKPNAVLCLGRRAGKGVLGQIVAFFNATQMDYAGYIRPGHTRYIVVIATSLKQAEKWIREAKATLRGQGVDPELFESVVWDRCTADSIVFDNNVEIVAMATSDRSVRGNAISLLIFDEAGHLQADSESVGAGREVFEALVPSMTQFKDRAYTLFTSTPMLRIGLFWDVYRSGTEKDRDGEILDPSMFVIHRATWEVVNGDDVPHSPRITRDGDPQIVRAYRVNPEWAATEYGADFMAAGGAFLDPLDILACERDTDVLAPQSLHRYRASLDPAFQRDSFALTIGHPEGEMAIVDGVWSWGPSSDPGHYDRVLDEVAEVLREYGVREARTDQHAGVAIVADLAKRGISCDEVAWDNAGKWSAYSKLKAALRTRQISLPRDLRTETELMNLIATATRTGLVTINAAPGYHDDRASAIAALMDMLEGNQGLIAMSWHDYSPAVMTTADSANPFSVWPLEPDLY